MIIIVDNGKGASDISRFLRMKNTVAKPAAAKNADAYILSDGDRKNQKLNEKLIKKSKVPILGIGCGALFIASAFGSKIKKVLKVTGQERLSLLKPCPLTLNMKRMFSVHEDYQNVIEELPEGFDSSAKSRKYEFEVFQGFEKPFFGVQFNPEKGLDGLAVLRNFEKFVEMWEKYH